MLLKQTQGDTNISRRKVKRKWEFVQQAELEYKPTPNIREVVKMGNVNRLLDQTVGTTLSIAALADHDDLEHTLKIIKTWAEIWLKDKKTTFEGEKDRRRKKFVGFSI